MTTARAQLPDNDCSTPATIEPDGVGDLLRRIIEHLGDSALEVQQRSDPASPFEVLLELQLDDARYLLLRRRVTQTHTHVSLSPREHEIARLIARGLPNKAIAAVLDISLWTVATYVRRLFAKYNVSSRAEMVAHLLGDAAFTHDADGPRHHSRPGTHDQIGVDTGC